MLFPNQMDQPSADVFKPNRTPQQLVASSLKEAAETRDHAVHGWSSDSLEAQPRTHTLTPKISKNSEFQRYAPIF